MKFQRPLLFSLFTLSLSVFSQAGTQTLDSSGRIEAGNESPLATGLVMSPVPEPSAALIGGIGALLLLRRRSRNVPSPRKTFPA